MLVVLLCESHKPKIPLKTLEKSLSILAGQLDIFGARLFWNSSRRPSLTWTVQRQKRSTTVRCCMELHAKSIMILIHLDYLTCVLSFFILYCIMTVFTLHRGLPSFSHDCAVFRHWKNESTEHKNVARLINGKKLNGALRVKPKTNEYRAVFQSVTCSHLSPHGFEYRRLISETLTWLSRSRINKQESRVWVKCADVCSR